MDPVQFLSTQIDEHAAVLCRVKDHLAEPFGQLTSACIASLHAGGKILLFGNGGSAADAQHLAAELVVRYRTSRKALAALALTTDTSILTACGNDFSYDDIFARQVEALAGPKDVVIGISTSGRSANVLKALAAARALGAFTAALTGQSGGDLPGKCDALLQVPSTVTARIQEMHILIGHSLCDLIEQSAAQI